VKGDALMVVRGLTRRSERDLQYRREMFTTKGKGARDGDSALKAWLKRYKEKGGRREGVVFWKIRHSASSANSSEKIVGGGGNNVGGKNHLVNPAEGRHENGPRGRWIAASDRSERTARIISGKILRKKGSKWSGGGDKSGGNVRTKMVG